jgi:hypothetical protein
VATHPAHSMQTTPRFMIEGTLVARNCKFIVTGLPPTRHLDLFLVADRSVTSHFYGLSGPSYQPGHRPTLYLSGCSISGYADVLAGKGARASITLDECK